MMTERTQLHRNGRAPIRRTNRHAFVPLVGAFLLGLLLCSTTGAFAEGPPDPEVGYVFPAGGKAGETVEVHLGIYQWTPDLQYFVHTPGVKLQIAGSPGPLLLQERPHAIGKKAYNPPPLPREVPAKFVIGAHTPPGPIRWQIANANGVSRTGIFTVSRDLEVVEDEQRSGSQNVGALAAGTSPIVISGRLRRNEEIDRYAVRRASSGPVTCELCARRLGAPFHGVIEVHNSAGVRMTDAVDTRGMDVACTFYAQAGVEYIVSVHDLDFLGNRAFVYRLSLAAGPRVVAAIPKMNPDGKTASVEFIGFGIATGQARIERVSCDMTIPNGPQRRLIDYRLETPFGTAQPVTVDLADSRIAGAVLEVPAKVTAEFEKPTRVHRYRFKANKGDRFALAATSQVLGGPTDLSLAVFGQNGKEQARNDDLPGTVDAGLEFVATTNGLHEAVVTDLSEAGTLPHVYQLSIENPAPDFSLDVPQRLPIVIGDKGELAIQIERTGGFDGPIRLSVDGLPDGGHVATDSKGLLIPPNTKEWKIPLAVDRNAPATASLVRVTGQAQISGREVARAAMARINDNLAPASPNEARTSKLLIASTLKPRVRIWPVESDERTVNRGTVHLAELGIERLDGFNGEVFFQLESRQPNKFRQGVSGPDVVIPPGQTRVLYPCFVSEELETLDAYRVSVSALARVRDPRGNEHWLVSNMQSTVSVALTIEGGLLKLSAEIGAVQIRPGSTVSVPVRILRSPRLAEPVIVRAVIPPNLSHVLSTEPVRVSVNQETANITLHVARGRISAGRHQLTLQAVATQAAQIPHLAEGLHATPLEPENLDLLARGLLPVASQAAIALQFVE